MMGTQQEPQTMESNETIAMMASQIRSLTEKLNAATPGLGASSRAQEVCRNYLRGRCQGKCGRQHPPGKEGSQQADRQRPAGGQAADKKMIKCFYCNQRGFHIARNCPQRPKGERANALHDNMDEPNEEQHAEEASAAHELCNYLQQIRTYDSGERANHTMIETIVGSGSLVIPKPWQIRRP